MSADVQHLQVGERSIAFCLHPGSGSTLVFLPGYASDMSGTKALALENYAHRQGLAMLRFDYSGTGLSSGRFEEGTLADWLEEALAAIDALTNGKLILVGSSMGAWIAMHLGQLRPERIRAIVGISAAPDFTQWGFSQGEKAQLEAEGALRHQDSRAGEPTLFTRSFFLSGQRLLVLEDMINLDCAVRLLHGEHDDQVPLPIALRLMSRLRSCDVQLLVIKGGNHRLSRPHDIQAILRTVTDLVETDR